MRRAGHRKPRSVQHMTATELVLSVGNESNPSDRSNPSGARLTVTQVPLKRQIPGEVGRLPSRGYKRQVALGNLSGDSGRLGRPPNSRPS